MILIFVILLIVLGLIFPKSKIITILLVGYIFIICSFSIDDYDYWNYKRMYEHIVYSKINTEIIYDSLMRFGQTLDFTYSGFRIMISAITLSILYFNISLITPNVNIVWSLYLIYNSMFNAPLLRNSLALSLSIMVLVCLWLTGKDKRFYLMALFLTIIMGLAHSSTWYFLIVITLWPFVNNEKQMKKIIMIFLAVYFLIPLTGNFIFQVYALLPIREGSLTAYDNGHMANMNGMIYNFLKYCVYNSPILLFKPQKYLHFLKTSTNNNFRGLSIKPILLLSNIINVNMIFCSLLILEIFSVIFDRLFTTLILINYVYLSLICIIDKKHHIRIVLFGVIYALTLLSIKLLYEDPTLIYRIFLMHLYSNPVLQEISL